MLNVRCKGVSRHVLVTFSNEGKLHLRVVFYACLLTNYVQTWQERPIVSAPAICGPLHFVLLRDLTSPTHQHRPPTLHSLHLQLSTNLVSVNIVSAMIADCLQAISMSLVSFTILGLFILVRTVTAVDVHAQIDNNCSVESPVVANCADLPEGYCCRFPRAIAGVKAVYFAKLQEDDVGVWSQATGLDLGCGATIETAAGQGNHTCIAAADGESSIAGGAWWFNCPNMIPEANLCPQRSNKRDTRATEELSRTIDESGTCRGVMRPTLLAADGEGLWALDLEKMTQDEYESFDAQDPKGANNVSHPSCLRGGYADNLARTLTSKC